MEEKKQNEELQSRRAFFKQTAQKALPIMGAIALSNTPVFAKVASFEVMGCRKDCTTGCWGRCYVGCGNDCQINCKGVSHQIGPMGCSGCNTLCWGCSGGCGNHCKGSCVNGCNGSAA